MVDIEQLPEDIYASLVALPYRVGVFISQSDKTGGADSEEQELAALESVVTSYVEDTLKSEFSQSIMLATLQHKTFWPGWREKIESVPDECRKVIDYLHQEHMEPRMLVAFKNNLLEIAVAVAMAYRETTTPLSFVTKIKNMLAFHAAKPDTSGNNPYLNISPAEKIAINSLADIFGITHKVA